MGWARRCDRAVVHYGEAFVNGFWDGSAKVAVLGDGDGTVFNGFYSPDVVAKEFANAVVQVETSLTYAGQSGSLLDALSLVVASMAKQHAARQTATEADWLIGTELFPPRVKARALYSLLDPGSAYDDPMLGKDVTVGNFKDYVKTKDDNGGVHVNSGIPARAFALSARASGDHSWTRAGLVWYRTMTSVSSNRQRPSPHLPKRPSPWRGATSTKRLLTPSRTPGVRWAS